MVWQCLKGLGRAPGGAPPWRELGMGHEEPVSMFRSVFIILAIRTNIHDKQNATDE